MFKMLCQSNGTFALVNTRANWPTCLEDIECTEYPPEIPTSKEYILDKDDGKVIIEALLYPSLQDNSAVFNSSYNYTEIPRNYNVNLTYTCGSARKFVKDDGSFVDNIQMTCRWDKTWSPNNQILPCDWVACLQPTIPPNTTNLRITDWDGSPVPFGKSSRYVCERGMMFEHDPHLKEVQYTCQDGKTKGTERGFFDTPDRADKWPVCLEGILKLTVFVKMARWVFSFLHIRLYRFENFYDKTYIAKPI